MRTRNLLPLAMVGLICCSGCTTLAKRGFTEFRGAKGEVAVISDIPSHELLQYGSVQVEQIRSDVGHLVPPEFLGLLRSELQAELSTLYGLKAGGPPLQLRGQVIYYQSGGSGIGSLLGDEKMAIVHLWLLTPDGQEKAEFLAVANSEALRVGEKELADRVADGVQEYLAKKLPEPPKER